MRVSRAVGAALTTIVAVAAFTITGESSASAATCPYEAWPKVDGREAHWTLKCLSGPYVQLNGWVKDTGWDGDCARLRVTPEVTPEKPFTVSACGDGTRTVVNRRIQAHNVDVELYIS
ncbi:hypothetical protein ABZ678_39005 [Streptomyces hirsutus]|uniref:hypothetical protein n=1 Tax=Streptomyces hirsutus TaxID=35620 RepID=UPI0033C8FABB